MKLHADPIAQNYIRGFSPGRLRINDLVFGGHTVITPERIIPDWSPADPERLTLGDLELVLTLEPEVILIGTGLRPRLPDLRLATEIMRRGIGFESMTTEAACRTFNILAAEYRRVAAALLIR